MKKILAILSIFLCAACSIKSNTPSQAVSSMLNAIQVKNTAQFDRVTNAHLDKYILDQENFYPDFENMSEEQVTFYKALVPYIQSFSYTIDNETIDNKSATVDVTITNYDINQCLQDIQQQALQQFKDINSTNIDDYYEITTRLFNSNIENYLTLTHSLSFNLTQSNQYFRVTIDDPSALIYSLFAPLEEITLN